MLWVGGNDVDQHVAAGVIVQQSHGVLAHRICSVDGSTIEISSENDKQLIFGSGLNYVHGVVQEKPGPTKDLGNVFWKDHSEA